MNKNVRSVATKNGNISEQVFVDTVNKVLDRLVSKYKFGFFEVEDMRQEGMVFALEVMPNYDESRPLENFLSVHIKNRFLNLRRDKYNRLDKPCIRCKFYDPEKKESENECTLFQDKNDCEKLALWQIRNERKQNLTESASICNTVEDCESLNELFPDTKDLISLIEQKLPQDMYSDYLRFMRGGIIPTQRKTKLINKLREIAENINGF